MKRLVLYAVAIGMCASVSGIARAEQCDAILRPQYETVRRDVAVFYAYMYSNAEMEYELIKNAQNQNLDTGFTYEMFKGEFDGSTSKEDFAEKIRTRITQEGFKMDKKEAYSLSRIYITDKQAEEWGKCMAGPGGALLLYALKPNTESFPLKVKWVPQQGVGTGKVTINLDGGTIGGKAKIEDTYTGPTNRPYLVAVTPKIKHEPDPQKQRVVIIVRVDPGMGEPLIVDVSPRVPIVIDPPPNESSTLVYDTFVCSGVNCDLSHIREGKAKGDWQVVRWDASRAGTYSLGPQMALSEADVKKVFCKTRDQLSAQEFASAVTKADFVITDNKEQAQFFDMNNPRPSYFEYSNGGRFYFFDNYENRQNYHIRVDVMLTLKHQCRH